MLTFQVPYPPYVPTDVGPDWLVISFLLLATLAALWAVLDADEDVEDKD